MTNPLLAVVSAEAVPVDTPVAITSATGFRDLIAALVVADLPVEGDEEALLPEGQEGADVAGSAEDRADDAAGDAAASVLALPAVSLVPVSPPVVPETDGQPHEAEKTTIAAPAVTPEATNLPPTPPAVAEPAPSPAAVPADPVLVTAADSPPSVPTSTAIASPPRSVGLVTAADSPPSVSPLHSQPTAPAQPELASAPPAAEPVTGDEADPFPSTALGTAHGSRPVDRAPAPPPSSDLPASGDTPPTPQQATPGTHPTGHPDAAIPTSVASPEPSTAETSATKPVDAPEEDGGGADSRAPEPAVPGSITPNHLRAVRDPVGGARTHGRPAGLEKVVDAIRELTGSRPPRSIAVRLDHLDGIRVTVSLRSDGIHLSVPGGRAEHQALLGELTTALGREGFDLAGSSWASADQGTRHRPDPEEAEAYQTPKPPRRPRRPEPDDVVRM